MLRITIHVRQEAEVAARSKHSREFSVAAKHALVLLSLLTVLALLTVGRLLSTSASSVSSAFQDSARPGQAGGATRGVESPRDDETKHTTGSP